ncbi:TraM recognition domain-containing protein, partial [Escherichia coli]|nr:TraM recognition domain-containing protein [Escherichia coli]
KELLAGSVVYIKSDLQDDVIRRAANCLLEEVIQVVRRISLSSTPHKYVQLTIDEARFMMTDTLANSLATVLSKQLLMTLAYQAREDPLNLTDKTLNGDSIKNGIETNTQITIVHRATEKETAQWISDSTGEAQKSITKMERVERNQGGAEEWTG